MTTNTYNKHLATLAAFRTLFTGNDDALAAIRTLELCCQIAEAKLANKLLVAQTKAADALDGTVDRDTRCAEIATLELVRSEPPSTPTEAMAEAAAEQAKAKSTRRKPKAKKVVYAPLMSKPYTMHGRKHPAEPIEGHNAEVEPGKSIRLFGTETNRVNGPVDYDLTFKVGDTAEYGRFNLHYLGKITAIGAKTVTIEANHGGELKRLDLATFSRHNRLFDLDKILDYNANERMYI